MARSGAEINKRKVTLFTSGIAVLALSASLASCESTNGDQGSLNNETVDAEGPGTIWVSFTGAGAESANPADCSIDGVSSEASDAQVGFVEQQQGPNGDEQGAFASASIQEAGEYVVTCTGDMDPTLSFEPAS